ncbi:transposase, partial [Pseudomonas aeruginosa]|nr:transposase [Pseudomonas aeruginosa]
LTVGGLEQHLAFRFERVGKPLSDVIDASAAGHHREAGGRQGKQAQPALSLAIGNLVKAAMNYAALVGEPRVTADVVREA